MNSTVAPVVLRIDVGPLAPGRHSCGQSVPWSMSDRLCLWDGWFACCHISQKIIKQNQWHFGLDVRYWMRMCVCVYVCVVFCFISNPMAQIFFIRVVCVGLFFFCFTRFWIMTTLIHYLGGRDMRNVLKNRIIIKSRNIFHWSLSNETVRCSGTGLL